MYLLNQLISARKSSAQFQFALSWIGLWSLLGNKKHCTDQSRNCIGLCHWITIRWANQFANTIHNNGQSNELINCTPTGLWSLLGNKKHCTDQSRNCIGLCHWITNRWANQFANTIHSNGQRNELINRTASALRSLVGNNKHCTDQSRNCIGLCH